MKGRTGELALCFAQLASEGLTLEDVKREYVKREYTLAVLHKLGTAQKAAEALGIDKATVYRLLEVAS